MIAPHVLAVSESWATWADVAVAAGTLALAVFTWALARQTRALAKETAEDVRAASRPVLIDAAGTTNAMMQTATAENFGSLRLTVRNAGKGPALNAYAYALVATRNENRQSRIVVIGNVAPEAEAMVVLKDVLTRDVSGSREAYLFYRVILAYADLVGRQFHSVIRMSDPERGQRRTWERGSYARDLDPGNEPHDRLTVHGTEVGEGAAPPQQWRVTFAGRELSHDHRARLRANGLLHSGAYGMPGGNWTFSVFASAERAAEAIERVRDALESDGEFVGFAAQPWESSPWALRPPSRWHRARSRAASLLRRGA